MNATCKRIPKLGITWDESGDIVTDVPSLKHPVAISSLPKELFRPVSREEIGELRRIPTGRYNISGALLRTAVNVGARLKFRTYQEDGELDFDNCLVEIARGDKNVFYIEPPNVNSEGLAVSLLFDQSAAVTPGFAEKFKELSFSLAYFLPFSCSRSYVEIWGHHAVENPGLAEGDNASSCRAYCYKRFDAKVIEPEVAERIAHLDWCSGGKAEGRALDIAVTSLLKRREKRRMVLVFSAGASSVAWKQSAIDSHDCDINVAYPKTIADMARRQAGVEIYAFAMTDEAGKEGVSQVYGPQNTLWIKDTPRMVDEVLRKLAPVMEGGRFIDRR